MAIAEAHLGAVYNRDDAAIVDHFTYCHLRRRRPHGRHQPRGGLACGPPQARQADRLLRRQSRLARGTDRRRASPTTRSRASTRAAGTRSSSTSTTATTSRRSIRRSTWQRTSPTGRRSSPCARTSATDRRDKTTTSRTARRSVPRTSRSRRKSSAGRSSPTSTFPTTCSRSIARSARRARELETEWKRDATTPGNARIPDLGDQLERALRARAAAGSAVAGVQRRERQRRDARRRRHGDERHRGGAPRARRRLGATSTPRRRPISRTAATSSPTTTPGATSTTACASTRWRPATNGIALHGGLLPFAATFFNFVDYLKPALRLGCLSGSSFDLRLHARLGLSRRRRADAPADRAAGDAARDAELLRHPAGRFARNARGLEARGRRARARPGCSCSRARSCRSSARATRR